jgi:Nucleotidyl transferase AbiEii toxin, Type IV TA system
VSLGQPRPPGNLQHLERLANAAAEKENLPPGRYRRWISTHIICAVLDRARDADNEPLFTLKGGAAMELRLGITARASKDLDAAFRERAELLLDALDDALSEDWAGFQLQRTAPEAIGQTNALRMSIRIAYKGRPWGTVRLEVAPAEGEAGQEIDRVPARPLDAVQLEGPERIACVSVRYQIAQKIHACTELFETGSDNDRFRDLIDIQLLRDLVSTDDMADLRAACAEIFELRDKQAWPPTVNTYPSWADAFEAMATEIDFPIREVEIAARQLRDFIAEIDAAG